MTGLSVAIKGIIFDLDGTVVDAVYDWMKIRMDLDTGGKPILAYINDLKEPERSRKWKVLEKYEYEATRNAGLKKGIPEFLDFLKSKKIKRALVTNNTLKNVDYLLNKFRLEFDFVLTRESGLWKPSGAPFLAVMNRFKLKKEECCVVGDSLFDIKAGIDAGITKILVINSGREKFSSTQAEIFSSVEEIKRRIVGWLEDGI